MHLTGVLAAVPLRTKGSWAELPALHWSQVGLQYMNLLLLGRRLRIAFLG